MSVLNNLRDIWGGLTGKTNPSNVDASPEVTNAKLNVYRRPPTPAFDANAFKKSLDEQYDTSGYGGGGGSSSYISNSQIEVPRVEDVTNDLANKTAELINGLYKDLIEVTQEMGNIEFDEEALRETALGLVTPFMEEELQYIKDDINEGRIQSVEDYNNRINTINNEANTRLGALDIRKAETDEDLLNTLEQIGANTDINLTEARANLKNILTSTEKDLLKSGLGFSGTAQEKMGDVRSLGAAQEADIFKQGSLAENRANTGAKYTLDMVANERLGVLANQAEDTARTEVLKSRQDRLLGVGEDFGLKGNRDIQLLNRDKETKVQDEIENLKNQKRDEIRAAGQGRIFEIQTNINSLKDTGRGAYI